MKNGVEEDSVRATDLRFDRRKVWVTLADGRVVGAPLELYPTLRRAAPAEREDWRLLGDGEEIHWPRLDLDLVTEQLVNGEPEVFPAPPDLSSPGRRPDHHVVLAGGVWSVRIGREIISQHATQLEAIASARQRARRHGGSVVVHRRDGTVKSRTQGRAGFLGRRGRWGREIGS